MTPYLIQRATFDERENKSGIDSILNFDYMGSAEFEFGALPKSLGRIRNELGVYVYLDIPIKNKTVTVFCKESQKTEVKNYLIELAENKPHLKEFSGFNIFINGSEFFKDRTDFWWDIKNDLMFWKKNPKFEVQFKKAITK